MQNLLIKINELKAVNYSRTNDSFDVVINFNVNNKEYNLSKHIIINKRPEILSQEIIEYVKNHVKDKNKPGITSDFLEGIVIVRYDDIDKIEEKIANFFKKFKDHVNNYKNRRYGEGFLIRYSTPDGFSLKIE